MSGRVALAVALLAATLSPGELLAQCVSLTTLGSAYSQDFDTLSNAAGSTTNNLLILGWFLSESGTSGRVNGLYAVDTGGSNTADTYSYGSAAATDRALGGLRSGTLVPIFGACFINNSGGLITSIDIAYRGEQWRLGFAARTDQIDFQYSLDATSLTTGTYTDVNALDFVTPNTVTTGAKDGNATGNFMNRASSIGSLSIANGATFWIRWTDLDAANADDGLSVDDFSLTPQGPPPLPVLSISDVAMSEGAAGTQNFVFDVTLTQPAGPGGVTFDIGTADDTATAGSDYLANALTGQTIPPGSTGPHQFTVVVNGDNDSEPTESFFVNVTNIAGATPGDTQGLGTITTDDAPPDLTIDDVTQTETNGGATTFTFTISLSAPAPPSGVAFDIATAAGTAIAGTDYVDKQELARTIPSGSTSATFTVAVNGDAVFENDETFFVNVTNVTGANIADGQGLGTVSNDDPTPTLAIGDLAQFEDDAGTPTMTFTVTLTGATDLPASVNYTTNNRAASSVDDYVTAAGTLNFTPGDTSETIAVTINGDVTAEGDEDFVVDLSAPTGATIADNQALGVIRNDDPVSIAAVDTPLFQNFDALAAATAAGTPTGWTFVETNTNANLTYIASGGTSTAGDTYSFGNSPDRTFGTLQSGSLVSTIGALYRNDTGTTITALAIQYFGEQWRVGNSGRVDRLDFQYSTDATSLSTGTWTDIDQLDFTGPDQGGVGSRDGNLSANRRQIVHNISGLTIAPGATFWIRFTDFNASGADDGLGVDDFTIIANFSGAFLSIDDVTAFETNGATSVTFTVSLTAPAPPGGVTFDIVTQDGSATIADGDYTPIALVGESIAAGNTSRTYNISINGDANIEPTETFFLNVSNVTNALVSDPQGLGTVVDDDNPITLIHDVQGSGASSSMVGSNVTIRGIVTGVKSNGFFVQEEDADADADPATSEGVFVFTGSTPPAAAAMGNQVQVSGTVAEFIPSGDPLQPPLTELTAPFAVAISTGNPLPAAIPLTATFPDPAGPFDQLERVEGMRVSIASLTVTGPSDGSFDEINATGTSNGRFFGVVTGVPRPFREPGIQAPDTPPSGTIPPIPRWDFNPERLRVESATINGQPILTLKSGDVVAPVTGPLDYAFRGYAVYPDGTSPITVTPGTLNTTVTAPTVNEVTVASFNLQRFFDNVTGGPGPLLTAAAYNTRLSKASTAIRNHLRMPDIIGVQEAERLQVLQDLAARISSDAIANSQPDPMYVGYLVEGNDVGGIDVGFLVKTAPVAPGIPRVSVIAVTQEGAATTWIDPRDGSLDLLNDRPPLVLDAVVNRVGGGSYPIVVINNHLRSLLGIESNAPDGATTEGDRVRRKRQAQAEFLANLVQARQTLDPTENLVLIGDFNAFEFNDGYVDGVNVVTGTPSPDNETVVPGDGVDLVNPDLDNLVDTPPPAERYSYLHEGNAQNIDHAIVNQSLIATTNARRLEHPRLGADYPQTERNNAATGLRLSDHDPAVAYFDIDPGILALDSATYSTAEAATTVTITVTRSGGTAGSVSAAYTIAAGTATAGADFAAAGGAVTFANGEISKTFTVTINDDLIDETDETVLITLSAPTGGATLGSPSSATLAIQDNDPEPILTIDDVTITEGNAGTSQATFTVTLTGSTSQTVNVAWTLTGGTASCCGVDFSGPNGNLAFPPGVTTRTIQATIFGDTRYESDETLNVTLFGATNATISDALGVGTIVNDDPAPSFAINDIIVTEGNGGTSSATMTVTLNGLTDLPAAVTYATADGTATAGSDYAATGPATLTFNPGVTTQTLQVPILGDTPDEADETVQVNLTSPSNATISDAQGLITIVDDDGAPSLTIDDVTIPEGDAGTSQVTFTVTLNGSALQPVSVEWTLTAGTATCCGVDFSGPDGSFTFPVGVTTRTIQATIFGDTRYEPDETINVTLFNATNATISDALGVGTIVNDDPAPSFTINDVSLTEGNAGTVNAIFTVTLNGLSDVPASVNYTTANGTASSLSDYTAAAGVLNFAPGVTTQQFVVTVNGDTALEGNETFTVDLTSAVNATISDPLGIGTIVDDEGSPTLAISDVTVTEGNSGSTNAMLTVTLAGTTSLTVTVDYATANGTATAGTDYTATNGTLTFAPGAASATITVQVSGDTAFEPNETFVVNLTNPGNATISDGQGAGTITNDDPQPAADLVATMTSAPPSPIPGTIVDFTTTVRNQGPDAATNTIITDTLPTGTTFVSAAPSAGTCTFAAGVVSCAVGTLAPSAIVTVTVRVQLPAGPGSFTNTASAASDAADANGATAFVTLLIGAGAIPTISEWMLILLACALAGFGVTRLRG
jgi:uncharacterized repeat protein (TIGR01451 family)